MNFIHVADCRTTMNSGYAIPQPNGSNISYGLQYHYVFTSPPDFSEIDIPPTDRHSYYEFLHSVFSLVPLNVPVTIAFTDRKSDGGIVPKSSIALSVFEDMGWRLHSHKIWVKSTKIDLFRLTYANVMTFIFGKRVAQTGHPDFKPDVWEDGWFKGAGGFTNSMPLAVPKRCILNFTTPGQTVYNPFMGIGQTALACIALDRKYIGSEISPETAAIAETRIEEYRATFTV